MWPITPPVWLRPWLIWRFRWAGLPNAPSVPAGTPKTIPPWAWGVAKWIAWCRNGRIPSKRPISTAKAPIPNKIPKWAWAVERDVRVAVPVKPPPPPPDPPNPVPPSSWKLPLPFMTLAWGPLSDWTTEAKLRAIAQKMVTAGVRTVGVQCEGGRPLFQEWQTDILHEYMSVAVWGVADPNDQAVLDLARADGYIPQVEGIYQYAHAIGNFEAGVGSDISRSIYTTLAGLESYTTRPDGTHDGEPTTYEVEELADAGVTHGFIELYLFDMTPMHVANHMAAAKRRGLYHATPVPGLAGRPNIYFSTYLATGLALYHRQIGVYLAEPMRDIDWADLRNLT